MTVGHRHTVLACIATIVAFPVGVAAIGMSAGLAAMNFQAPADVLFLLSWLPPALSIWLIARGLDRWLPAHADGPVLAIYLLVALCGLGIAFLGDVAAPTLYGVIWSGVVIGTACLCHWPRSDSLQKVRPIP
ncbi:hypothetical protein KOAAANKH_02564 [Brevundimonas sp. NIBR10]|uniref:hypothetical protein n=1 Tax=Brevundimonas sp. NIBR10 TaxID=3015997 RepID=UPI0022F14E95|nr:hypothetical protein [Brevundimonas sp. NIBR10]WGM47682.1 hypothetical protein KOAAANKH_02564 [Brevundimonas sp. NIBR10]